MGSAGARVQTDMHFGPVILPINSVVGEETVGDHVHIGWDSQDLTNARGTCKWLSPRVLVTMRAWKVAPATSPPWPSRRGSHGGEPQFYGERIMMPFTINARKEILYQNPPRPGPHNRTLHISPVLRGAGVQLKYGRDIVAPPRKQAANREHKLRPVAPGDSCLLEARCTGPGTSSSAVKWLSKSSGTPPRLRSGWLGSKEKPAFSLP